MCGVHWRETQNARCAMPALTLINFNSSCNLVALWIFQLKSRRPENRFGELSQRFAKRMQIESQADRILIWATANICKGSQNFFLIDTKACVRKDSVRKVGISSYSMCAYSILKNFHPANGCFEYSKKPTSPKIWYIFWIILNVRNLPQSFQHANFAPVAPNVAPRRMNSDAA